MKPVICLCILTLLILSCNGHAGRKSLETTPVKAGSLVHQSNQIKTAAPDTMPVDPSKIECIPSVYRWVEGDDLNFSPGTFGEITYVYNSTKINAKIIDTLPFNTSVSILREYQDFFLVCVPPGKSGYIKKTDLYIHSIFWGLHSDRYLFGIIKYGTNDNTDCNRSLIQVIKISESKKILDVYRDSIMGNGYTVKLIYNSALKNSDALFYLNYNCYHEVETDVDHFIVDNGEKLSQLIVTSGSGDGEIANISTIYLPLKLDGGTKIVLAKNGVLSVDGRTAKPELFPYPVNCGIPIDELVVEQSESQEDLFDDTDKKPLYNKDGTMAEKITDVETIYYHWDGNKLKKVKTIEGK